MNSLRSLSIEPVYTSEEHNLLGDFYIPCLRESHMYLRSSGYFRASVLLQMTTGLHEFFLKKGKIRYLIGPELTKEDQDEIALGYERRVAERIMTSEIDEWKIPAHISELFWGRIKNLSLLIEHGLVDFKIALRTKGIFHEKVGIFQDKNGDGIVFQGSANETNQALQPDHNFESFDVNRSWIANEEEKYAFHLRKFEKLWENNSRNTLVLDFTTALQEKLFEKVRERTMLAVPIELELWNRFRAANKEVSKRNTFVPQIPKEYKGRPYNLLEHQESALRAWLAHQCRGIIELCTGAGKTVTAIHGAVRLFEYLATQNQPLLLVVCVPYLNLAEQWVEELGHFQIGPIECYGASASWQSELSYTLALLQSGGISFASIVVVNKTLIGDAFQRFMAEVGTVHVLWIGDEVHHHDSAKYFAALPEMATYRLGLSATIQGCQRITSYYGESISQFRIKEALHRGILTPYQYFPFIVFLTDEEEEEYISYTRAINQQDSIIRENPHHDSSYLNILQGKRADLLGNAANKLTAFRDAIARTDKRSSQFLVYCSSTIIEEDSALSDGEIRQIDEVTSILNSLQWSVSQYTSKESKSERQAILENFKMNHLNAMVAIRCLDEGVDIPAVESAFILASSSREKQYVQRRGRVLRKSAGKTCAKIYDLVLRFSPKDRTSEQKRYGKKLLLTEMRRVLHFADDCINKEAVLNQLQSSLSEFDITSADLDDAFSN